jgi:hypothetical protein
MDGIIDASQEGIGITRKNAISATLKTCAIQCLGISLFSLDHYPHFVVTVCRYPKKLLPDEKDLVPLHATRDLIEKVEQVKKIYIIF